MSDPQDAMAALRALRGTIDALIESGLEGDPEVNVEALGAAYSPAFSALVDLWPDDEVDEPDDRPTGPVVTIRSRTDYVLDDVDTVIGEHGDLSTAIYELLHDRGRDLYVEAPGLRVAIGVHRVHSGLEALNPPDPDVAMAELLTVDPKEQELRGVIDVF